MLGARRPRVLHGAADMRQGGSHATARPPSGLEVPLPMVWAAAGCLRGPGATGGGRPSASPDQRARFLWASGTTEQINCGNPADAVLRCKAVGAPAACGRSAGSKAKLYAADPAQASPCRARAP